LVQPTEKVLHVMVSLVIKLMTLPIKKSQKMINLFMTSHREFHTHGGWRNIWPRNSTLPRKKIQGRVFSHAELVCV